jgi:hypothetical protein
MPTNNIRRLPSRAYLQEFFTYNRRTGELRWNRRDRKHFKSNRDWSAWNTLYAGKAAGVIANGYYSVRLFGVRYQAHRLIWKLVTDVNPVKTVDHIDLDKLNNRWSNLRLATFTEQQYNAPVQKNNTSGYRGVSPLGGKWRAGIWVNGKNRHLGVRNTRTEATILYRTAARKLHGKFYREQK